MPLSVVDLYRDILPKTNCGDCGHPTCMAFASMVVSEKLPLGNCPHLEKEMIAKCNIALEAQYAAGKWLKRDMAQDALEWSRKKASSMKIKDLPERIGGKLTRHKDAEALELPYFTDFLIITDDNIERKDGKELTRWEKVFIYNHIAHGGRILPAGNWKGLIEFPNTVSKIKSMIEHVEKPLIDRFKGKPDELLQKGLQIGGIDRTGDNSSANAVLFFIPLPRVPVMLMFWDEDKKDNFDAKVKLMFDETITEHLDIESIMFLSERIRELLCE